MDDIEKGLNVFNRKPNGRDLNLGIIGGTGLRAGEASNPFGNHMNTGEVSNGAVISDNTVGNVDASKLLRCHQSNYCP